MKKIFVAAAIMLNAEGEVFIAERPEGKIWPGYWEFPGGKVEADETPEVALHREIKEEIGVNLGALEPFGFISESRADEGYHVIVLCYLCRHWQGIPASLEKQRLAWVKPEALDEYRILPSNIGIAKQLKEYLA